METKEEYLTINEALQAETKRFLEDDDLQKSLYNHAIGSNYYDSVRDLIQKVALLEPKYDETLICFKSSMHRDYGKTEPHPSVRVMNMIKGVRRVQDMQDEYLECYIENTKSFMESTYHEFKQRRELEYNPEYKQLVVAGYIFDGTHAIIMKTKEDGSTRIENRYTFIQGHVEFTQDIYTTTQDTFLLRNLMREFEEEVTFTGDPEKDKMNMDIELKYVVNDPTSTIGIEHLGYVYEMLVPDAKELYNNLTSGEPDKHELVLINVHDCQNEEPLFDNWVKKIFDKM